MWTFMTALALGAPWACESTPGDWPQFRGALGDGIAYDQALYPESIDVEHPTWTTALPAGHSSPCVVGDRIFLTGHEGTTLLTVCLDRETGEELWRRETPVESLERSHELHGPASSTPAADAERVIVYFGSFGLIAYDHDGKELWSRRLARTRNTFGSAASPVLSDGRVIFLHDNQERSGLESIDAATGETIWRTERPDFKSGWSTPTVRERGGRTEILVYGVWWLVAYDAATGDELWRAPGLTDEPITSPTPAGDLVLVTSYNMKTNPEVEGLPTFQELLDELDDNGNGTLDRSEIAKNKSVLSRHDADGEGDHPLSLFTRWMDGDRNGEVTEEEWKKIVDWVDGFAHVNGVLALRPPAISETAAAASEPKTAEKRQAEVVWSFPRGVPECPSPLVVGPRVYFVKNGGLATCLDAASGELVWQERLGSRGPCYASPVFADGKIYSCSARGELTVFAATAEFRILSRAELDDRILATPALAGGVIYVRTASALHAFSASR